MNSQLVLIMVYLFGEFGYILYVENAATYFEVAGESPEKIKQVESAIEAIKEQMRYRHSIEAPLRTDADEKVKKFETKSGITFTDSEPDLDTSLKSLWKMAKIARDKHENEQTKFEKDKFCEPLVSDIVCERAFENDYFKTEKLTHDGSKTTTGNGCIDVLYTMQFGLWELVYTMQYKSCFAKRENNDGTVSLGKVYFQVAYQQPYIGKWRYFIIVPYTKNETTGLWERLSDPDNDANINYRYESYTYL